MVPLQFPMMGQIRSWAEAGSDALAAGEMAEAVAYFRRVFGEQWNGWEKGSPFATVFGVSVQGGPREWVRIHRLIKALDGVPNVEALVRSDLGSSEWTEFAAAVMSLEFCARMRRTGAEVEFIETAGQASPPDAKVMLAGRWVTIEFKAIYDPDEMKKWHELTNWVMNEFLLRRLDVGGLEVEFDEEALAEREALLEGLLAVYDQRPREFQELPRQTGRARANGLVMGDWGYPVLNKPELQRLLPKLRGSWWKKFRGVGGPTVIVVRTRMLFGATDERTTARAEDAAALLIQALESLPIVGAVLIYDDLFGRPPAERHVQGRGYRLSIGGRDGCARVALLVPNAFAAAPLNEPEMDALVGPNMRW